MTDPTTGITAARRAHSARCRQRVIKALDTAVKSGDEISVSGIARMAGVDRTFLYRHPDLHALVMAKAVEPPASPTTGLAVSRASLIADLAGAHDGINRLVRENVQLRDRLSEALGEQAWRESGLGGPDDIDDLRRRNTELEQQVVELRRQLGEKDDDLDAARCQRHVKTDPGMATEFDPLVRWPRFTRARRTRRECCQWRIGQRFVGCIERRVCRSRQSPKCWGYRRTPSRPRWPR